MVSIVGFEDYAVKVPGMGRMLVFFLTCSSAPAVSTTREHGAKVPNVDLLPLCPRVCASTGHGVVNCVIRPSENVKDFAVRRTRRLGGYSLVFKKDQARRKVGCEQARCSL